MAWQKTPTGAGIMLALALFSLFSQNVVQRPLLRLLACFLVLFWAMLLFRSLTE